ncbi:unnamed protein product [Parnassius apollo]|uniref:(apollo) hypothetical protein n=1 Tax=Parnassius apollo TaxID=110799 RepID=A0A8S3WXW4_PARAO|nr:unnamed protein product [Parnassius apollo]
MDWDLGSGLSSLRIEAVHVNAGERHEIIAKLLSDNQVYLSVDGETKIGTSTGFLNLMNADSNIYIDNRKNRSIKVCFETIEPAKKTTLQQK